MQSSSLTSGKESILVVDDDPGVLSYTRGLLEMAHYRVETASCGTEAVGRLRGGAKPDLILLDMSMPQLEGLRTIEACRQARPEQKIVVLSSDTSPSMVVEAMRRGALDYISKPVDISDLQALMDRWLPPKSTCAELEGNDCETIDGDAFFLASSPAMKKIRTQIAQLAKVEIPVLLLGESGVGKEVVARLLHKLSPRASRPSVKVNCAAIPADLLESELFGYEAGAFTGATRTKPGKFELCDQGTILLDEIGEMSPLLQAKLLHVLQDGQFSRLGGRSTLSADFRLLAATNINMERAIENGTFREDLFYRLNAFTTHIPPLRERREEIEHLMRHFLADFSKKCRQPSPQLSPRLTQACMQYHWPGNLRELGNFVKRYVVFQDEKQAIAELEEKSRDLAAFPEVVHPAPIYTASQENGAAGLKSLMKDLKHSAEVKVIEEALAATKWNRRLAAVRLQISCKALRYKIKQYRISPPETPAHAGVLRAARISNA
ncbi:MAG TPA: sigma-54 dependent transcriptional regulator [Candidatus Elarobacter sp.]|nr:sigma-54 dependent transcriptional regulator [Candidatus Elarobacter sp.]